LTADTDHFVGPDKMLAGMDQYLTADKKNLATYSLLEYHALNNKLSNRKNGLVEL